MYKEQQMKEILNRLTLIGSRAWGGHNDDSDYDTIEVVKSNGQL